jgi:hypothetical protein
MKQIDGFILGRAMLYCVIKFGINTIIYPLQKYCKYSNGVWIFISELYLCMKQLYALMSNKGYLEFFIRFCNLVCYSSEIIVKRGKNYMHALLDRMLIS